MNTVLKLSLLCTILCLEGSIAASIECPAVDPLDRSVYFPHESDCSKFYECSNGVPILLSCSKGTLFNPDLNVCDWPENVVCQNLKCPEVDPIDTSIYFPHESDCSKFYECSNGVPIEQSCGSGTVFNPKVNVCDFPPNVNSCTGSGGTGGNGEGNGKGNDGNDGSGGDNGSDDNGGRDDNDRNSDNSENDGNGGSDGHDGNAGNDKSDGSDGKDGNDKSDGSDGKDGSGGNGSGSEGSGVCSAVDPVNQSVYLPHESECSKFYKCSNGVPVELSCRSDLVFNTNLNVCDYPENVGSCLGKNGRSNDA